MQAAEHLRREEHDEAEPLFLKMLEHRSDLGDFSLVEFALQGLGFIWRQSDREQEAIDFFAQYSEAHPQDAEAFSQRAIGYWHLGQTEKAFQDFSQALNLSPENIGALLGRAQVLYELGRYEEAQNDIELMFERLQSVPLFSEQWKLWKQQIEAFGRNCKASLMAAKGRFEEALKEFDASITLVPENAWVYFNRAHAWESNGRNDNALLDYERSLQKAGPKLSPSKREYAEARVRELKR